MNNRHTDSMEKTCEEVRALVALYSIGAVLPEEQRLVESMLPYCPEAAEELADHLALSEALVYAVPQNEVAPPVETLLIRVEQYERSLKDQKRGAESVRQQIVLPQPVMKPNHWWLGLVAAVLLVVLFTGTNLYWANQLETLREEQRQLFEQLAMEQTPEIVLTGSDHHRHLSATTVVSADASAILIWNSDEQVGSLYVNNLPQLPENQAYQVWLLRDEHHITLGTFRVDESGVGSLVFHSPEPVENFQIVGISAEPAAGTDVPTTPHVLTGEI